MGSESTEGTAIHIVDFSVHFARIYSAIAANDAEFIDDFVDHVEQNGLNGLPGRLKCSWDISADDPMYASKSQYAKTWNLWHYHLGMPAYDTAKGHGNYTSEWILHLRRHPCGSRTTIVDWDSHPPFALPKQAYLWLPDESPIRGD